jgi:hypothetical protein
VIIADKSGSWVTAAFTFDADKDQARRRLEMRWKS